MGNSLTKFHPPKKSLGIIKSKNEVLVVTKSRGSRPGHAIADFTVPALAPTEPSVGQLLPERLYNSDRHTSNPPAEGLCNVCNDTGYETQSQAVREESNKVFAEDNVGQDTNDQKAAFEVDLRNKAKTIIAKVYQSVNEQFKEDVCTDTPVNIGSMQVLRKEAARLQDSLEVPVPKLGYPSEVVLTPRPVSSIDKRTTRENVATPTRHLPRETSEGLVSRYQPVKDDEPVTKDIVTLRLPNRLGEMVVLAYILLLKGEPVPFPLPPVLLPSASPPHGTQSWKRSQPSVMKTPSGDGGDDNSVDRGASHQGYIRDARGQCYPWNWGRLRAGYRGHNH